jgi:DNA mismatch endonuclease (patch repair protein)
MISQVALLKKNDKLDNQTSVRMSAMRRYGTAPELKIRKALKRLGLKIRTNVKSLPGTPDVVLPDSRIVIFCHGCFWHHHKGCKKSSVPKANKAFWIEKFSATDARDARDQALLRELGWIVLIAWECDILKNVDGVTNDVARVHNTLSAANANWLKTG